MLFTDLGNAFCGGSICSPEEPSLRTDGSLLTDPLGALDGLRASYGFGFRWFSPIGPLRFEWGFPVEPRLGEDPGRWDRISLWITNSARITNPVQYTVVQLQPVVDQPPLPGEAPARPVADPDEPVVSVVMMRDLGNLRLRPALVTIGSLLVFLALCHWLHVRDKEVMARREEFESEKA